MIEIRTKAGSWRVLPVVFVALMLGVGSASAVYGQDCTAFLSLFQQGLTDAQVAGAAGITTNDAAACRRQLQRPIVVGPQGPPPVGAAGPAPRNAAGPPPRGAAGPPPIGAAGPPPVGREVKRLP